MSVQEETEMISISDADWLARQGALRNNSIAAMIAAIEVYNKPKMEYRSECFVILIINSWELLFKAILTKNQRDIFNRKNGDESSFSISIFDAMKQSKSFFPSSVSYEPLAKNIEVLNEFRNNAVHFYNEEGFDILFHSLAQTTLSNYRELVKEVFQQDIADELDLILLPLSFASPPDPIQFLKSERSQRSQAVTEYIKLISETTKELEAKGEDTGRFLTIFTVNLQSQKKIQFADIVAAVTSEESVNSESSMVIPPRVDPNKSYPLRRKDVLKQIGCTLHDVKFTTYTFQAIVWCEKLKENPRYYWELDKEKVGRYSQDVVTFLRKNLAKSRVQECLLMYKKDQRRKRQKKK